MYTVQKVQLRESEKKYFEKIQEETPKESCESPKVQPSDVQSLPAATKPICKVSDKVEILEEIFGPKSIKALH